MLKTILGIARKLPNACRSYACESSFTPAMLVEQLKEQGFTSVHRGAYSVVVVPPGSDKAYKICLSADDGFHQYVKWIKKNRDKLPEEQAKHIPVIHSTTVIRHNGIRVTVMEQLQERTSWLTYRIHGELENKLDRERKRQQLSDDLGGSNVMRRGRVHVVTDPWAQRAAYY